MKRKKHSVPREGERRGGRNGGREGGREKGMAVFPPGIQHYRVGWAQSTVTSKHSLAHIKRFFLQGGGNTAMVRKEGGSKESGGGRMLDSPTTYSSSLTVARL